MEISFKNDPRFELPVLEDSAISRLRQEGALFVDVRTAEEVAEGTVAGSKHIPLQELPARIAELEEYTHRPLVLFCRSGARSDRGAVFLRERGFLHAWNAGGYEAIIAIFQNNGS